MNGVFPFHDELFYWILLPSCVTLGDYATFVRRWRLNRAFSEYEQLNSGSKTQWLCKSLKKCRQRGLSRRSRDTTGPTVLHRDALHTIVGSLSLKPRSPKIKANGYLPPSPIMLSPSVNDGDEWQSFAYRAESNEFGQRHCQPWCEC